MDWSYRYDEKKDKVIERPPRIAALCGGKQDTQGLPLCEQDIIVVTAGMCTKYILI